MVQVGLPTPRVNGIGHFRSPTPQLLSIDSTIGQLVIYSNYIGVITEISAQSVRINTKYNQQCSNLCNTDPILIDDEVIIGRTIIID